MRPVWLQGALTSGCRASPPAQPWEGSCHTDTQMPDDGLFPGRHVAQLLCIDSHPVIGGRYHKGPVGKPFSFLLECTIHSLHLVK